MRECSVEDASRDGIILLHSFKRIGEIVDKFEQAATCFSLPPSSQYIGRCESDGIARIHRGRVRLKLSADAGTPKVRLKIRLK